MKKPGKFNGRNIVTNNSPSGKQQSDCIIVYYVFAQPLHHKQDMTKDHFLTGVQLVWIPSFSLLDLVHSSARESSLFYYLSIVGGRTDVFMPFPRELALSEMQAASSRVWTLVTNFIFYDDSLF